MGYILILDPEKDLLANSFSDQQKYLHSSLSETQASKLFAELEKLFESEQPFLDPKLSLKKIADRLDSNTAYLSQTINGIGGCGFQEYVQGWRVREVQRRIREGAALQLTYFGIAKECGFQNRGTFFYWFRCLTGNTPRFFHKSALIPKPQSARQ